MRLLATLRIDEQGVDILQGLLVVLLVSICLVVLRHEGDVVVVLVGLLNEDLVAT